MDADARNAEMDEAIARDEAGTTATPVQQATAALLADGEDPGEVAALAMLAGVQREVIKHTLIQLTADQTNAPWGSENVTKHPPQKPYGATEPPNKDQSPASYGFLSAPDPDNWGSIQEDSAIQMPLTNTAAWYHGSPWRLAENDRIEPGQEPVNMEEPDGHVYFTSSSEDARAWAKNGTDWVNEYDSPGWTAHPHVYEVKPTGDHDIDPQGEFEGDRRSRQPLEIVREMHGPGFLHLHDLGCPGCARQTGQPHCPTPVIRSWCREHPGRSRETSTTPMSVTSTRIRGASVTPTGRTRPGRPPRSRRGTQEASGWRSRSIPPPTRPSSGAIW